MIVLDASAAVEWLLQTSSGVEIAQWVLSSGESLHAPHLLDVEVTQVLRRAVNTRAVSVGRAREALEDLLQLRLQRYPHFPSCVAFGSCTGTSLPMMPCMSHWRKPSAPPC